MEVMDANDKVTYLRLSTFTFHLNEYLGVAQFFLDG